MSTSTGPDLATRSLTRTEITQVLQGIVDTPSTPSSVASAAFWSTLTELVTWNDPDEVEAARVDVARRSEAHTLIAHRLICA
jgi:hypothetical protein